MTSPARRRARRRGGKTVLHALAAARLCLAAAASFSIACAADKGETGSVGGGTASAAGSTALGGATSAGAAGTSSGSAGLAGTTSGGQASSAGAPSGAGGTPNGTAGAGGASAGAAGRDGEGGRGGTGQAGTTQGGAAGGAGRGGTGGLAGGAGTGSLNDAPPIGKKFVGNIDTRGQIRSDFVEYWNQITPENAGKWDSVEKTRDEMDWTVLDSMHSYAKQHGIIVKHHTLVWGSQQPSWLSDLSAAEQREEVEEWIRLLCERYPDTALIDVVNEPPPHTTPPYVAALGGAGTSGYDWIAQAFKWAHQYCPNAILILNDFNNIEYENDNAHTIDIAKKILAAGAPIHAIGAQGHDAHMLPTSTVQMYIDRLANQTGLPVYISEYDIPIADDGQQRSVMESQFTMFWNNNNVKGITLWGYVVGSTWKANTGIISSSGTERPAMTWLLNFLKIR